MLFCADCFILYCAGALYFCLSPVYICRKGNYFKMQQTTFYIQIKRYYINIMVFCPGSSLALSYAAASGMHALTYKPKLVSVM